MAFAAGSAEILLLILLILALTTRLAAPGLLRQVASYMGLTPAPFSSGDSQTDQGLDKSGNARARCAAVQMAWMWLRHQPQSELSLWYMRRVGDVQGRIRRIMIIGLARKLVTAL